jgi:S-layer homology domain
MSCPKQKLSCKNLVVLGSCLGAMVLAEIVMPRISGASTSINSAAPVDPMVQTTLDETNALELTEQSPAPKVMDKSGDRVQSSANIQAQALPLVPTPIKQSSVAKNVEQAYEKSGVSPDTNKPAAVNYSAQANLSDISGHWAEPFIRVLTDNGIIAGYPDGTFQPDRPVTRAEFAALVNKAFPDSPEIRAAMRFARPRPTGFWQVTPIELSSPEQASSGSIP